LGALDRRGLRENTVVMYVCDNGWINRRDRSRYAPRSKRSPNEGGIRTPIMVRWPGKVTPRRDDSTLVSSIDLVPTGLAAAGIEIPPELPGLNLMDRDALGERDAIFGEILEHDIQSMDDPAASLRYRWVIQGPYKLIEPSSRLEDESPQLYHVIEDPHETNDLADDHPEIVRRLRETLNDWWEPPTA
jgi:uncharacterized sulfatase